MAKRIQKFDEKFYSDRFKEQRMYERIKEKAQKAGRYGKRVKKVAARTVMKKHKQKNMIRESSYEKK